MVQDNLAAWEPSKDSDQTFEMVQEINAGSPNIKVVGVGGGGEEHGEGEKAHGARAKDV